jgi:glycosyltransferase involved in cell wall biosynthesis
MEEYALKYVDYSTTRTLSRVVPDSASSQLSKINFDIFRGSNGSRLIQGGLRVNGYFKYDTPDLPLITVITIVFNGVKYIEETIKSVITQDYDNVEYLVIDGGSSDGTVDILEKYNSEIDYWFSEPDDGISDAFNKGLSLSRGRWIGIINADDWYQQSTLSSIVEYDKYDIVYGDMQSWRAGDPSLIYISDHHYLDKVMTLNHPSVFVKRDVYALYGGFDVTYRVAMDYEILLRFFTNNVSFFGTGLVYSNLRVGGVSDRQQFLGYDEVRKAKLKYRVSSRVDIFLQHKKSYLKAVVAIVIRRFGGGYFLNEYSKLFSRYKSDTSC